MSYLNNRLTATRLREINLILRLSKTLIEEMKDSPTDEHLYFKDIAFMLYKIGYCSTSIRAPLMIIADDCRYPEERREQAHMLTRHVYKVGL